jgi:hypothetical protein
MAKISARGAMVAARVKRSVTLSGGTVATVHRVLCSDGRILERTTYRQMGGRRYATEYALKGKTIAVSDSWLVAQLANGWTRD